MTGQFQNDFEDLVRRAVRRRGEARSHYRGFSPEEVWEVERAWGRPLPPAYRGFLLVMGRRAGLAFECGYVEMSFDGPAALLDFQKHAYTFINKGGVACDILPGAFFCSNYLDSQLSYLDSDMEVDDPPLFDFEIGNPKQPFSEYTFFQYIKYILSHF